MAAITLPDLTTASPAGTGVFDVLMQAVKAHLDQEFLKGRIKGPEYATVYMGSLEQALSASLSFLLQKQKADLDAQLAQAQIGLVLQQTANAVTENLVLVAQECKLRAEFDLTTATTMKVNQELQLLTQKTATERAQTLSLGVDADSVIGRQKGLYVAQTNGFTRDAEQKAAKLLVDTWSVRRTTDEATVADGVNMLNDTAVGRAVNKLLTGVGA